MIYYRLYNNNKMEQLITYLFSNSYIIIFSMILIILYKWNNIIKRRGDFYHQIKSYKY